MHLILYTFVHAPYPLTKRNSNTELRLKQATRKKFVFLGLGGGGLHNVILVSKPRDGSVGNQIAFAYFLFLTTLASTTFTKTLGINSRKCFIFKKKVWFCLFYVCVEAMAFQHKGIKEIKQIQFGLLKVTEGYLSSWHVQWTEKQISMSISQLKSQVLVFLCISDTGDVAAEKENWIASEIAFYMGSVRNKCGGA